MTEYFTGNPVGSTDPRDLYDNMENLDLLLLGSNHSYPDRLGVPRRSWQGILQQVTDYLIAQGYESVYLVYGAGVVVERQTQLVQRGGELYRVMNAADVPLTLSGDWATDAPKLQAVGDAALRQLLASPDGAERVGYKGATVGGALDGLSAYSRSKVLDLPFRDSFYDSLVATYSYNFLYPQSFAVDAERREVFVLKGASSGANSWAWIWVHDLDTGAVKTRFTTGQQWRESLVLRRVGSSRFLYTIGNSNAVIKLDLTTLPANLATVSPVASYSVVAQSMLAFDGQNWYVQDYIVSRGTGRRNRFKIYDVDFVKQTGELILPTDATGTLQSYANYFPKMQGACFYDGKFYIGCGGDFNSASSSSLLLENYPVKLQGIQAFTSAGDRVVDALCAPAKFKATLEQMMGRVCTVTESEGVSADGGSLYSIWQTLTPEEWATSRGISEGIAIVLEYSNTPERVSFAESAMGTRSAFNAQDFQLEIHHSSAQLKNPVTDDALDTFQKIITMMNELDIARYSFSGTNQTITDINGAVVAVSGRLVEVLNVNGFTIIFKITGGSIEDSKYVVSGGGTSQVGPLYDAEYGSNANGEFIRHSNGVLECWTTSAATIVCTTATSNIFRSSGSDVWTYPASFLSGTVPEVSVSGCFGTRWGTTGAIPTNTGCSVTVLSASSDATARPYQARAVGRWK
jgi:hypothetical protein